jgi:FKBP-type peptidyl-prolyl cis-trans isomerase SlyD
MQIADSTVVTIDYTIMHAEDGEELDTSRGGEPLSYLHGAGNIIRGLERALAGRSAGEDVTVTIPPEDGYGLRDEDLVQALPRRNFPAGDIEVGSMFRAEGPDGSQIVTVVALDADSVTIDANHPLAGFTLNVRVSIRDVRAATDEECRHGHPHGSGGAHD